MGISDEDYANAIEHQRLHERALMKLELEKVRNSIVSTTTTGALHYPNNVPNRELRMRAEDLDHEAAKVSLEILKDMWVIRWQDRWVNKNEIVEDDFWRIAFARLENVNKLERHILADTMQYVYRIIE